MDHWDPAVTDGLAEDREVILFNNAGIGNSSGEVPASIPSNGRQCDCICPCARICQSGRARFSIGGMVAQEMAVQAPDLFGD